MRIGLLTVPFHGYPFEEALDRAVALGVTAVEIGVGGYPGSNHCLVSELLASAERRQAYMEAINSRGLIISAFSVHNNPIASARQRPHKRPIMNFATRFAWRSCWKCPWLTVSPAYPPARPKTVCPTGSPAPGHPTTWRC